MAEVFLCYSQRDYAFAKVLREALSKHYQTWVDWVDIPPAANWREEIGGAIEAAHSFIFVMSRASVRSIECLKELDYAVSLNKQILPILLNKDFSTEECPPTLFSLNWVSFQEHDDFDLAFQSLLKALQTDLQHVKLYNQLYMKALEWEKEGRHDYLLLRGKFLKSTETWLYQSVGKEPRPTALQIDYVKASRKAANSLPQIISDRFNKLLGRKSIRRQRSIFISYRRSDSQEVTRKIYDRLAEHFGHETVFRDLDSIPAGRTFKEYIEDELKQCQVLIAVIGPTWLTVQHNNGQRRIDDPEDWVRLEIQYALKRNIPVIPLLINDTSIPRDSELPEPLKKLSTYHAARVRYDRKLNPHGMIRLTKDIDKLLL